MSVSCRLKSSAFSTKTIRYFVLFQSSSHFICVVHIRLYYLYRPGDKDATHLYIYRIVRLVVFVNGCINFTFFSN